MCNEKTIDTFRKKLWSNLNYFGQLMISDDVDQQDINGQSLMRNDLSGDNRWSKPCGKRLIWRQQVVKALWETTYLATIGGQSLVGNDLSGENHKTVLKVQTNF